MKLTTVLTAACVCAGALAHMELIEPAAIDSKFAGTPVNADSYSMTNPLKKDGSMYPCRGQNYLNNPALLTPRTTWNAGSMQTIRFDNNVSHFGGSCQYALSYDMGKTFNVFYSEMGGCMIVDGTANTARLEHQIPLPADVPNGNNVLFAWYWQARNAGSPEAYHDCAVINIAGGSDKVLDEKDYPPPWTGFMETNDCRYERSTDIVYPRPGLHHVFGGSLKGGTKTAEQTTTGTNCEHKGGGMKSLPAYSGPAPAAGAVQGQAQGQQSSQQSGQQGSPQGNQGSQGGEQVQDQQSSQQVQSQQVQQSPTAAQPSIDTQGGSGALPLPPGGSAQGQGPVPSVSPAVNSPAATPASAASPALTFATSTGLPSGGTGQTNALGTSNAAKPCKKVHRRRRRRSTGNRGARESRSRLARDETWERAVEQIRREERWNEDLEALARRAAGL